MSGPLFSFRSFNRSGVRLKGASTVYIYGFLLSYVCIWNKRHLVGFVSSFVVFKRKFSWGWVHTHWYPWTSLLKGRTTILWQSVTFSQAHGMFRSGHIQSCTGSTGEDDHRYSLSWNHFILVRHCGCCGWRVATVACVLPISATRGRRAMWTAVNWRAG